MNKVVFDWEITANFRTYAITTWTLWINSQEFYAGADIFLQRTDNKYEAWIYTAITGKHIIEEKFNSFLEAKAYVEDIVKANGFRILPQYWKAMI